MTDLASFSTGRAKSAARIIRAILARQNGGYEAPRPVRRAVQTPPTGCAHHPDIPALDREVPAAPIHVRTRRWIYPQEKGEPEVKAFLTRLELATGFELPIMQRLKKLRQLGYNDSPSRRAI